jgi:hypothetical protein
MSETVKREHCKAWDDFAARCEETPVEIEIKPLKVATKVRRLRNIRRK